MTVPRRPPAPAPQPPAERSRAVAAAAAGLLLVYFLLAVTSDRRKTYVFDELIHVTKAAAIVRHGDYRLDPTHGPLVHHWVGIPLRFLDWRFPPLEQPAWNQSDGWTLGHQFFMSSQLHNDVPRILWWTRAIIALLGVGLGWLVFRWSRSLFGAAGGLMSLTLYAFDPTLLAHGTLVTTDLAAGLFFIAALHALWRLSHRVSVASLAAAAAAVGGLFLAKFSAVLLVLMGGIVIVVRIVSRTPIEWAMVPKPASAFSVNSARNKSVFSQPRATRAALLLGLSGLLVLTTALVLWAGFGFRWSPFIDGAASPAGYERDASARVRDYFFPAARPRDASAWRWVTHEGGVQSQLGRWIHRHKLLPDAYMYGYFALQATLGSRDAFLNGERSPTGWRSFFPYAFLIKTPLPLLAMLLLALAAQVFNRRPAEGLYHTAPLWALIVVYGLTSVFSNINIGHRHILPLYPAIIILAGSAAGWLRSASRAARFTPVAATLMIAPASLSAYPHYLAYFNALVGGPRNGYKHLVDSSLDWGQDLDGWADWCRSKGLGRPESEPVYLHYFGKDPPRRKGVAYRDVIKSTSPDDLRQAALGGGWYCFSATSFQQLYIYDGRDHRAGVPLTTRWVPEQEALYQRLLPAMRELERLPDDAAARLAYLKQWQTGIERAPGLSNDLMDDQAAYSLFQKLRCSRLCAHLRKREPDEMIGYSILIYRVSGTDAERFVHGPPP